MNGPRRATQGLGGLIAQRLTHHRPLVALSTRDCHNKCSTPPAALAHRICPRPIRWSTPGECCFVARVLAEGCRRLAARARRIPYRRFPRQSMWHFLNCVRRMLCENLPNTLRRERHTPMPRPSTSYAARARCAAHARPLARGRRPASPGMQRQAQLRRDWDAMEGQRVAAGGDGRGLRHRLPA